MFIEDIIAKIAYLDLYKFFNTAPTHNFVNSYDLTFINNIYSQISPTNALTVKQAALVLRILKKYTTEISALINQPVEPFLNNPRYKYTLRTLSTDKTVKIENGIIKVSFPYNEDLINLIKTFRRSSNDFKNIRWNSIDKIWEFDLDEEHIFWLSKNFKEFYFDEQFKEYLEEIKLIQSTIDIYVPMVSYKDNKFSFVNSHKNIPQPLSENLYEVLYLAKKYGINVWDNNIEEAINSPEISPVFRSVIQHTDQHPLIIKISDSKLEYLKEIIQFSKNVLFVIPGGTELEHLKEIYIFLKREKYQESDMSVMFRLDSSANKMCNDFIREQELNNPLSNNTRFVFVSGKLSKPIIAHGIEFDTVIHFGMNSAHYTLKNYIKNHHNVIVMTLQSKNTEMSFV
jgi:hypothetical protein